MNVVALVQPVEPTELERLAERINVALVGADRDDARAEELRREAERRAAKWRFKIGTFEGRAVEKRLHAGFDLIEARGKLKAEDPRASFEAWCEVNIKDRSLRQCYRYIEAALDYDQNRCVSLVSGRSKAILDGQLIEAKPQDASADILSLCQQSKYVQSALRDYRNASPEERLDIKKGQEEIDNA